MEAPLEEQRRVGRVVFLVNGGNLSPEPFVFPENKSNGRGTARDTASSNANPLMDEAGNWGKRAKGLVQAYFFLVSVLFTRTVQPELQHTSGH